MTNINTFYAKALTSVVVPPGTNLGGFIATGRFSYGFQVFEINGDEEVIVLNDGTTSTLSSAQWNRHQMFAELADMIYQHAEVKPTPAEVPGKELPSWAGIFDTPPILSEEDIGTPYIEWSGDRGFPHDLDPDDVVEIRTGEGGVWKEKAKTIDWVHRDGGRGPDVVSYRIISRPGPELKPGFTKWECDVNLPFGVDGQDTVEIMRKDGAVVEGRAAFFSWGKLDDNWDYEIAGYRVLQKAKVIAPADFVKNPAVDDVRPCGEVAIGSSVEVFYRDGRRDSGLVEDFKWGNEGGDSDITHYRVVKAAAPKKEEPAPVVKPGVICFYAHGSYMALGGYNVIDDVWGVATEIQGRVTAFCFEDGHIEVAKDGAAYWDSHMREQSTFRPAKPNEMIVSYRVFPADLNFNDSVPGANAPLDVAIFDAVQIFFPCGEPVTKRAFEIDWGFIDDVHNAVVAYRIVSRSTKA